jgi:UDP-3-O-[3-hydroxymyristoyl] glucosamine N-acyltransferase
MRHPKECEGTPVSTPISEIARWVGGEIVGDAALVIQAAKPLSDVPAEGDITLLIDPKYVSDWQKSPALVAIVAPDISVPNKTMIRVADPLSAFITIVQKLHVKPVTPMRGVHPTAVIDPTANVSPEATVGPHVVVGEGAVIGPRCTLQHGVSVGAHCVLGEEVTLAPHVVLYPGCIVGNRVTVHANSVIGADGFGYRMVNGKHAKIPQVGYVQLEDDVEIGACTTIDRGALGVTRIGAGTKIDNLVMVAHNCKLGKHNVIVAQVGMAGSVTTGDYVVMAGHVGIKDHVHIGDRSQLGAMTGVHSDIPSDQNMLGVPARPIGKQLRLFAAIDKLPDTRKDVKRLGKDVAEIKKKLGLVEE